MRMISQKAQTNYKAALAEVSARREEILQGREALQRSASPDDYERIVSAYLIARRSDKAVETLKQALAKRPSTRLWHMTGGIHYDREEIQEAYSAFQRCFQMTPDDGSALLFMGYCALKMGKTNEAQEAFRSAVRFRRYREPAEKALTGIRHLTQRGE